MNPVPLGTLCSHGLRKAPSQVSGGIRLVPLIRDEVRGDLRLGLRGYTEDLTLVNLGGRVGGNSPWLLADALASVTVVSHADDYAAMHRSLLLDGYGELIWQYACRFGEQADHVQAAGPQRKPGKVKSSADLRDLATTLRADLAAHFETMGAGLFDREIQRKELYSMAGFKVEQFLTDLTLGAENHIGECIRRGDGTVEYLKTFRLSAAQVRRAHLLRSLHEHEWNIEETAKSLGTDWKSLMLRIEKVELGFLLRPEELARARKM